MFTFLQFTGAKLDSRTSDRIAEARFNVFSVSLQSWRIRKRRWALYLSPSNNSGVLSHECVKEVVCRVKMDNMWELRGAWNHTFIELRKEGVLQVLFEMCHKEEHDTFRDGILKGDTLIVDKASFVALMKVHYINYNYEISASIKPGHFSSQLQNTNPEEFLSCKAKLQ